MTAPMCAEHRCPPRECEGVELTLGRRFPDLAGTIAVVALRIVIVLNALGILALAVFLAVSVGWPLARAVLDR